jgi:DNA-binding NarL/FixJ family response regulator
MIRVAVVEDDRDLRAYMEETIHESEGLFLSGSFSNAEEFRQSFSKMDGPDVVVMDINLPGISGIQCISEMKQKAQQVQYLVCTVFEDNVNLFNALCAGATGYILKSASEEEFVKAINDIHKGGSPMSPQIARMVVNAYPGLGANRQLLNELNKREQEILELLAAGYRYKEIADKLFLGVETIRSYIRNIYSKLHVHSRTDAINKVYGR